MTISRGAIQQKTLLKPYRNTLTQKGALGVYPMESFGDLNWLRMRLCSSAFTLRFKTRARVHLSAHTGFSWSHPTLPFSDTVYEPQSLKKHASKWPASSIPVSDVQG